MAIYGIESDARYKALAEQFKVLNGRAPNDLDKMSILEQLQLDRIESTLARMESILEGLVATSKH